MKRLSLALALAVLASGCATVEPWEKERLASPVMRMRQQSKGQYFLDHVHITVEQAEGGTGMAGGGCGCR